MTLEMIDMENGAAYLLGIAAILKATADLINAINPKGKRRKPKKRKRK